MKKYIKIIPAILISSLIYFFLLETNFYVSESSVKLKNTSSDLQLSIIPGLSSADEEIYELREFIFSQEGLEELKNILYQADELNGFKTNFFDLNKQYFESDEKYLKGFINISIDDNTNIMKIFTTAYTKETSLVLNKTILYLMQFYFDRKQNLSSLISSTNSICNFVNNDSKISNFEMEEINKDLVDVLKNVEADNVFYEINLSRRDSCLQRISTFDGIITDNTNVPTALSMELKSMQSEQLLKEYIQSEQLKGFTSDKIVVISNPKTKSDNEDRKPLLKSFVLTLSILISIVASRILIILFRET